MFSYCHEIVTESVESRNYTETRNVYTIFIGKFHGRSHLEDVYLLIYGFFNDVATSSGYTVYRGMVDG